MEGLPSAGNRLRRAKVEGAVAAKKYRMLRAYTVLNIILNIFAFRQCSYLTLAALISSSVILRSLFCAAVGGISLIRFSGVEKSP